MRSSVLVAICLAASCGSSNPVGTIRFHVKTPVWRVDDRRPQKSVPREAHHDRYLYKLDGAFTRRVPRAMEMRPDRPVHDVNSIGEVPDSTWFTNRIGVRDLTLDELKRGPNLSPSPFDHRPWTIVGAKAGGKALGFRFVDSLQRRFILKFDDSALPELETGAHIIVQRILWAAGYYVPEDHVGFIRREDIVIGDKARKDGVDEATLDAALKLVYRRDDGAIRVLASLYVSGKPIVRTTARVSAPTTSTTSSRTSSAAACAGSSRCSHGLATRTSGTTTRSIRSRTATSRTTWSTSARRSV